MSSFELVKISDLRPDPNNPRRDFSGLDDLAESFEYSYYPGMPGTPIMPIMAAKDGNVYRIIDGERRYRAMSDAGKVNECMCLVVDPLEDADYIAATLATNKKASLTEQEMSYGVQSMLALGVDEAKVANLGNFDKKSRQHITAIGDMIRGRKNYKPVQATIYQLMAISELTDEDDRNALLDAAMDDDKKFTEKLRKANVAQEQLLKHDRYLEFFKENGIDVYNAEQDMDGFNAIATFYYSDKALMQGALDRAKATGYDRCYALMGTAEDFKSGKFSYPKLYANVPIDAGKGKDEARRERISSILESFKGYRNSWKDFAFKRCASGQMTVDLESGSGEYAPLATAIWNAWTDRWNYGVIENWLEDNKVDEPARLFPWYMVMEAWGSIAKVNYAAAACYVDGAIDCKGSLDELLDFADVYECLCKMGYKPGKVEKSDLFAVMALIDAYEPEGGADEQRG